MKILYLFLSLFASQLFLATPSVIIEEQVGNRAKRPVSEVNKTESESTNRDTPPFLLTNKHDIMRGIKGHVKGPLLQAECKFPICFVLIVFIAKEYNVIEICIKKSDFFGVNGRACLRLQGETN